MEKLTREEVLHVANLAKLELNEEEIDKFSYQLKSLLDEINKINDIEESTENVMIAPWNNDCKLNKDEESNTLKEDKFLENAPSKVEHFIEVKGVFHE